jgi:Fe-S cluster biogenesis protein NfuA
MTVNQANEELKSNCSGGCPSSSADGKQGIKSAFQDRTVIIVSIISVVAIVGLYLHYKKK